MAIMDFLLLLNMIEPPGVIVLIFPYIDICKKQHSVNYFLIILIYTICGKSRIEKNVTKNGIQGQVSGITIIERLMNTYHYDNMMKYKSFDARGSLLVNIKS